MKTETKQKRHTQKKEIEKKRKKKEEDWKQGLQRAGRAGMQPWLCSLCPQGGSAAIASPCLASWRRGEGTLYIELAA